MLTPSNVRINGDCWDLKGPPAAENYCWPKIVVVVCAAGMKRCFPHSDHRGVTCLPLAIRNRKILLVDLRRLQDSDQDRYLGCIGRHPGIISAHQIRGWNALDPVHLDEKALQGDDRLVALPFCNSNCHRSGTRGTIISCIMCYKDIEHGRLHIHAKGSWSHMSCGGSLGRATAEAIVKRVSEGFKENLTDHDCSDSPWLN